MMKSKNRTIIVPVLIVFVCIFIFCAACATVGREFPTDMVSKIKIGETTKVEINRLFGPPWRTGIEDGDETWTYGHYRYRLFGASSTTDLVIRYDKKEIVRSYSFNTTEGDE